MAQDYKISKNKCLSKDIQARAMGVLAHFRDKAIALGCSSDSMQGVATQVFRSAANGQVFLDRVRAELGINIRLISQELEGELGWRTACALCPSRPTDLVISWDSGGASFQVSALDATGSKVEVYEGPIGTTIATHMLVERVQGKSFEHTQSPNPASRQNLEDLLVMMRTTLPPCPVWLSRALDRADQQVVAYGGPTAAFTLAHQVVGRTSITPSDLWTALTTKLDRKDTDPEMTRHLQPEMIVSKLAIAYVVMRHLDIKSLDYRLSVAGNAPGIAITPSFWPSFT